MSELYQAQTARSTSPLLTKSEAAAFCRVSVRTFERFVQAKLPAVRIGVRLLYASQVLQRCRDAQRDSRWSWTGAARSTTRGSRMQAGGTMSRQESEILAQLRKRLPRSTAT